MGKEIYQDPRHHDLFDNIKNDSEGIILHLSITTMATHGLWHGFNGQGKENIKVKEWKSLFITASVED